jgi:hypothetical protein
MVKKTVDESKNEFNSKLLLLHQESIIVNVEYEKAVRMSNLTTTAINCFDALEQQLMKKDTDKCCYTTHRKRWIRAIEQVLLQNRALKAKRPADHRLTSTPKKKTVPVTPSSSKPICRRSSLLVSDGDSDSEKCLSECSTAADDGNGDETDTTFKSKSFLDSANCRSDFRDKEALSQYSRAELFMNSG